MSRDDLQCELCGATGASVRAGWGWYRASHEPVQAIDRCIDRAACRARVEATGVAWPLRERGDPVVAEEEVAAK